MARSRSIPVFTEQSDYEAIDARVNSDRHLCGVVSIRVFSQASIDEAYTALEAEKAAAVGQSIEPASLKIAIAAYAIHRDAFMRASRNVERLWGVVYMHAANDLAAAKRGSVIAFKKMRK